MAQGTVNFANLGAGVNAPIFDTDTTTKLGAGFTAELWAGATANSLAAVKSVSFSTSVAGVFLGGSTVVPGVAAGSPAFYQVRVWNSGGGFATWGDAVTGYGANNPAAKIGFNNIDYANPLNASGLGVLQTPNLGGGPVTPPNLLSLTSFHLVSVPEPSVIALGILGVGALLLRRRK